MSSRFNAEQGRASEHRVGRVLVLSHRRNIQGRIFMEFQGLDGVIFKEGGRTGLGRMLASLQISEQRKASVNQRRVHVDRSAIVFHTLCPFPGVNISQSKSPAYFYSFSTVLYVEMKSSQDSSGIQQRSRKFVGFHFQPSNFAFFSLSQRTEYYC